MNRLDDTSTATPHEVERPLLTDRLRLRSATVEDTDATWTFRRLESVNEWLTGCPPDLDGYRDLFTDPDRLATTVIVELADGTIIGDFMLRRGNRDALPRQKKNRRPSDLRFLWWAILGLNQ